MAIKQLTPPQKDAVNAKGAVVVTAAAGSGKTAVLVERVIHLLCREEEPVSADRLLIVTFTRAAAAELRMRLEKRIASECSENPSNMHLQKQRLLLSAADICTIDSFCIKLIREHFQLLEILPDFKIADESQATKLRSRAVNTVFKRHYDNNDEDFSDFLRSMDSVYSDSNAADAVLRLYDYSQSLPFYNEWFKKILNSYNAENFEKSVFCEYLFNIIIQRSESYITQLGQLKRGISGDDYLTDKYFEIFFSAEKLLLNAVSAAEEHNYVKLHNLIVSVDFPVIRAVGKKCDQQLLAVCRSFYKGVRNLFADYRALLYQEYDDIKIQTKKCQSLISVLINLTNEFEAEYHDCLRAKGLMTFALAEQTALKLLCNIENNKMVLSKTAASVCERYDEVMVDEFQDVNDLQNLFFEIVSDNGKKLFTVGDAKQSIYGFRGANPSNFIKRSENAQFFSHDLEPDVLKRIVLSNNFRSRSEICNFINGFFSLTMSKQFGSLNYDSNEMLYPAAEFKESSHPKVCAVFKPAEDKSPTDTEAEAVALHIERLCAGDPFLSGENNGLRKANYSDIAVLARKTTGFYKLAQALSNKGIPVSIGIGDFFKTAEIKTIRSLISAIDKPMRDLPLLAAAMSVIGGISADKLARLRLEDKSKRIYSLIRIAAKQGDLQCEKFVLTLSDYRTKAICMSVGDLVHYILQSSGYYYLVSAMPDPKRRIANLELFEELANGYSEEISGDISGFLRYLDYLENSQTVKSQSVTSENSVKLMTIHSSKGLQFPCVVLMGCGSPFSTKDTTENLTLNDTFGLALSFVDDEKNRRTVPFEKRIMNEYILQKQHEEELRLLYVAMTRAEESLSFVFCNKFSKSFKEKSAEFFDTLQTDGKFSFNKVNSAGNYASWLLPYILILPSAGQLREHFEISDIPVPLVLSDIKADINIIFEDDEDLNTINCILPQQAPEIKSDENILKKIEETFSYEYPFKALNTVISKTSVSQLTKSSINRDFCAVARPAFLSKAGLTPTERGTALHKFMQYADFKAAVHDLDSEIDRLEKMEFLSKAETDSLSRQAIERFLDTKIFKRMLKSENIYREQRFLLEVAAGKIYSNIQPELRDKKIIVQGAIDCMFKENEKIVLIDFKTDRTKNKDYLLSHYSEQLKMYKAAAQAIFGLPVEECYIYSLYLNEWIKV